MNDRFDEFMREWVTHFGPLDETNDVAVWAKFVRNSDYERLMAAVEEMVVKVPAVQKGLKGLKKTYFLLLEDERAGNQAEDAERVNRSERHHLCRGSGLLSIIEAGSSPYEARMWPRNRKLPAEHYVSEGVFPCSCSKGQHINEFGLQGVTHGPTQLKLRYDREFMDLVHRDFAHGCGMELPRWLAENTLPPEPRLIDESEVA